MGVLCPYSPEDVEQQKVPKRKRKKKKKRNVVHAGYTHIFVRVVRGHDDKERVKNEFRVNFASGRFFIYTGPKALGHATKMWRMVYTLKSVYTPLGMHASLAAAHIARSVGGLKISFARAFFFFFLRFPVNFTESAAF